MLRYIRSTTFLIGDNFLRVAMISDLHMDINRVNVSMALKQQSEWLTTNQIGVYLIAGDLFNHFNRTLNYCRSLQAMTPGTTVRFVAGNHDMVNDVSFDELEQRLDPTYLHNQYFDVPGTDWRIIGNNGWYDYSFANQLGRKDDAFWHWKKAYWIDGAIKQPLTDPKRLDLSVNQLTDQFKAARHTKKKILLMTHFVPCESYIRRTADDRFWNMANAMLGSTRTEQVIKDYQIEKVLFGHMHIHPTPRLIEHTTFYNQSVGYGTKRRHEWLTASYETEWQERLRVIDLS